MKAKHPSCAHCPLDTPQRSCMKEDGKGPASCPTKQAHPALAQARAALEDPQVFEFSRQASIQEAQGYGNREAGWDHLKPVKPRIAETIEFAHKMKYKRLGLVFCAGLSAEAQVVDKLLLSQGFEVVSVICKVGCVSKDVLGLSADQRIHIGEDESMCNPISQAKILNAEKTEFNIVMGLCVGHDSLFLKYAEAPCTVLVAKDRLLGHNPVAAIYTIDSYYRALKNQGGTIK